MPEHTGRVVMVTGATGNLGQAVARALLAEGARLVLVDRGAGRLAERFPAVTASDHLLLERVDVTVPDDMARAVAQTVQRFGRLDALVNTVGGYRAGQPVHEMALDTWDEMLNLNARSVLVTCRAVIPQMLKQGDGRIVNTAAKAALSASANAAAYSVAKTAVLRLTESMAAELKRQGITVNCVLPGTIDTPGNRQQMPDADVSRWVSPEQVAEVMLFLISDRARAVTGAAIPVYGKG